MAFSKFIGSAAVLAASLLAAGTAQAGTLGIASGYNEFILGNVNYAGSDVQGKIAVGGNLTATGTSLADKGSATGNNVIVGGTFTGLNGSVTGNVIANNVVYTNPTISGNVSAKQAVTYNPLGGGTVSGTTTYGTTFVKPLWMSAAAQQGNVTVPIDFAAEFTNLKNISLNQVSASDPYALYQYSQAYFNATPGTGIKVFNVAASTLASATGGYNISADANSTVIINVSCTSANLLNTGFNLTGGITANNLIWNFYEATSLNFDGSVTGTVLAPKAAVTASYGGLNGTLIAASLSGPLGLGTGTSLEAHTMMNGTGYSTLFTGTLRDGVSTSPDATRVPEPQMLALFGLGVLGLIVARRRPIIAA